MTTHQNHLEVAFCLFARRLDEPCPGASPAPMVVIDITEFHRPLRRFGKKLLPRARAGDHRRMGGQFLIRSEEFSVD